MITRPFWSRWIDPSAKLSFGLKRMATPLVWFVPWLAYIFPPHTFSQLWIVYKSNYKQPSEWASEWQNRPLAICIHCTCVQYGWNKKQPLKFGGLDKKKTEEVFVSSVIAVVFFRQAWGTEAIDTSENKQAFLVFVLNVTKTNLFAELHFTLIERNFFILFFRTYFIILWF